jgi:hypothetical protein
MKITKIVLIIPIILIFLAVFFLAIKLKKTSTPVNTIQNETRIEKFDNNMTEWGPKLSKDEVDRISKMSVPELVNLFKTGDTIQAYEALRQLKKEGGLKKNFDLLLKIAGETKGAMITEGLLRPIKISAPDEDKRMVDKYLDFLESQLKNDKPSVPYNWAVRNIGQVIHSSDMPGWNWLGMYPRITDPNKIDIPYANERATYILISCVDSNNRIIRREAINWLGAVGANDFKKIGSIIKLLNDELIKEQDIDETGKTELEMTKTIISLSLRELNQKADELEAITKGNKLQVGLFN